jgi:hypothetical protein
MKGKAARGREAPAVILLPEFRPMHVLWEGAKAPYPSEQSARWAVSQHRAALVEAGALALSRGRVFVHPARFAQVIEREAIRAMERRVVAA